LRPGGRALVKVSARKTVMSVEVKRVQIFADLGKLKATPTPVPKKKGTQPAAK